MLRLSQYGLCMKIALHLDDQSSAEVKQVVAQRGQTVRAVIEEGLRQRRDLSIPGEREPGVWGKMSYANYTGY